MPRIWEAALLISMLMCMFYLWGRVQMNKVQGEKTKLVKEKEQLVAYRKNLEIEINQLKSLGNISKQVAARGLTHISASMTDDLVVSFNDESRKKNESRARQRINYAGIRLPGRR